MKILQQWHAFLSSTFSWLHLITCSSDLQLRLCICSNLLEPHEQAGMGTICSFADPCSISTAYQYCPSKIISPAAPKQGYGSFSMLGLCTVVTIGLHAHAHIFTGGKVVKGPNRYRNRSNTVHLTGVITPKNPTYRCQLKQQCQTQKCHQIRRANLTG